MMAVGRGGRDFDGDAPPQTCVFRFIDHPHPALADLVKNPVMGNNLPDHKLRIPSAPKVYRDGVKNNYPAHPMRRLECVSRNLLFDYRRILRQSMEHFKSKNPARLARLHSSP